MKKFLIFATALFLATTTLAQESDLNNTENFATNSQVIQKPCDPQHGKYVLDSLLKEYSDLENSDLSESDPKAYEINKRKIRLQIQGQTDELAKNKTHQWAKVHRGFHFATTLGFDFLSMKNEATDDDDDYNKNNYKDKSYYNAYAFPNLDFRFGAGFANLFIVHYTVGFTSYVGESSRNLMSGKTATEKIKDKNTTIFDFKFAVGTTFYPFRNINSSLNGLFFGIGAAIDDFSINHNVKIVNGSNEFSTLALNVELGKDWWISDLWSAGLGLSASYSIYSLEENNDPEFAKLNIMFRIARR